MLIEWFLMNEQISGYQAGLYSQQPWANHLFAGLCWDSHMHIVNESDDCVGNEYAN